MDIRNAITQRRTIRRFLPKPVKKEELVDLVSLSRLYASGGNLQPIRYVVVTEQGKLDDVFETLRWAAYLPDFQILCDNRPKAYVVLTADAQTKRSCQFDLGAAATTLMLAAEGCGLSTCCLASFDHTRLTDILALRNGQEPLLVIALGYPAQKSRAVDYTGDVRYYEDENGCLCVPKYTLDELLTVFE